MLFGEPAPTQGDLHFSIFGFPVRIHPMFWLVAFVLGLGAESLPLVFVWVAAVFISILIHELGHAFVLRRYGITPRITLHGMGGVASYNNAQVRDQRFFSSFAQIAISAAGPGAGFLFAGLIAGAIVLSGKSILVDFEFPFGPRFIPVGFHSLPLAYFVYDLLFISITWGLFNLLPIYPLDGGNISRELFLRFNTRAGIRRSLTLSFVTAAAAAVLVLASSVRGAVLRDAMNGTGIDGNLFVALLFGYLAYFSYAALQAYNRQGPRY